MERVPIEQLIEHPEAFDAAVAETSGIDPFCSRSEWEISFHEAFLPDREVFCWREADAWVLLAASDDGEGVPALHPLESMWGFSSPIVGPDAERVLGRAIVEQPIERPVVLTGIPHSPLALQRLSDALPADWNLQVFGLSGRRVASIEGGVDAFLSRRSPNFRRNARKTLHRVEREAIRIDRVPVSDATFEETYARILAIERRSWKGASGRGVDTGPMRRFYAAMIPRLLRHNAFRLLIASRDGEEVGYLHGGVIGEHFRGFQFSFAEEFRGLSLGNALQLRAIEWLAEEGLRTYDLGMDVPYKKRWADDFVETYNLALLPPGLTL